MVVEIGVRAFRSRLSYWLDRAACGDEVIVTERGRPRARVVAAGWQDTRERLIAEGVITPARRPKEPIEPDDDLKLSEGTLSDIVIEQRRAGF